MYVILYIFILDVRVWVEVWNCKNFLSVVYGKMMYIWEVFMILYFCLGFDIWSECMWCCMYVLYIEVIFMVCVSGFLLFLIFDNFCLF